MTGSQPHPGTGIRMTPDASQSDTERALRIPDILRALGVRHVALVNPFDFDEALLAVRAAIDFEETSAIVFKAPCITVAAPKPQPVVYTGACTNCKVCIQSIGCPALVTRAGQVTIDKTLCYGCNLCVRLCPFKAILPASPGGDARA
jgi:indolepyruvate ferredoxin oxidoreductase alpha subunit